MGRKFPNPFAAVGNWISQAVDQQLQDEGDPGNASAPVPVQGPQPPAPTTNASPATVDQGTTIVTGRFVPSGDASELFLESAQQTERFRRMVEKFDEDRQEPIEWLIRKGASLFCYVAPFALAGPIGLAVGDAFTSARTTSLMAFAIHLLSVCLEVLMPILGLATTISFKRALKDRAKMAGFVGVALFFLSVSFANGLALLVLLEKGLDLTANPAISVGIIGRSFGAFVIDVGCTIYLTVSGLKSLQKYLADQRSKIVAIRDVNQVNIELEQTQIQASIHRQTALMDMQSKQQRAQTWNEIEKIQAETMIDQARRSFKGDGGDGQRRSPW